MQELIVPSLVGAIFGFLSSIGVFYFKELYKSQTTTKQLRNNLRREIKFNIRFLEMYLVELQELLDQVSQREKDLFFNFKHHKVQSVFILKALNQGLLYKPLNPKDIVTLDYLLTFFNQASNEIAINTLHAYEDGKIEGEELIEFLENEINFIQTYRKFLDKILPKINAL